MSDVVPVVVPQENVNDESVLLLAWNVSDGDVVTAGQVVAEVEGRKASFEIEAPADGFVRITRDVGEEVPVGAVLCHVAPDLETPLPDGAEPVRTGHTTFAGDGASRSTRFSHKARRLIEERALSEDDFHQAGLVRELDVLRQLGEVPADAIQTGSPPSEAAAAPPPVPSIGISYRTEPLSRSKRLEARYIASSYYRTLRSAVTIAVPTRGFRDAMQRHEHIGQDSAAVIVFECARLLRKYPVFNGFFSDGNANLYDEVNVGFAIDADRGLKVPVIRNADTKSLHQIADELRDYLVAYVEDELPVDSLAGGTFTVTDLSGEGVLSFDPLINQGQSAILGVSSEFFAPGSREGLFNLTLAYDHHLADGRTAARFLNDLRDRLEGYERALRPGDRARDDQPYCFRCSRSVNELVVHHYLVNAVRPDGSQGHLCTVCLGGW